MPSSAELLQQVDALHERQLAAWSRRFWGAIALWLAAILFMGSIGLGALKLVSAAAAAFLASPLAALIGLYMYVGGRRRIAKVDKAAAPLVGQFYASDLLALPPRENEVMGSVRIAQIDQDVLALLERKSFGLSRVVRLLIVAVALLWVVGGLWLLMLAFGKLFSQPAGLVRQVIVIGKLALVHVAFPCTLVYGFGILPLARDVLVTGRGEQAVITAILHRLLGRKRCKEFPFPHHVVLHEPKDGAGRARLALVLASPNGHVPIADAHAGPIQRWQMERLSMEIATRIYLDPPPPFDQEPSDPSKLVRPRPAG